MKDLLKAIEPRWIVAIYGLYILSRAIRTLFEPEYAAKIVSGDEQFGYYQMTFSFLALTFLHPLVFSTLSVEVAKKAFSIYFFLIVVFSHWIAVTFAALLLIEPFAGNPNLAKCEFSPEMIETSLCIDNWENFTITWSLEAKKGLAIIAISPFILAASTYWWKKPILIFRKSIH